MEDKSHFGQVIEVLCILASLFLRCYNEVILGLRISQGVKRRSETNKNEEAGVKTLCTLNDIMIERKGKNLVIL